MFILWWLPTQWGGSAWCLIRESSWKMRGGLAGLTMAVTWQCDVFWVSQHRLHCHTPTQRSIQLAWAAALPLTWDPFCYRTAYVRAAWCLIFSSCGDLGCMMRNVMMFGADEVHRCYGHLPARFGWELAQSHDKGIYNKFRSISNHCTHQAVCLFLTREEWKRVKIDDSLPKVH